MNELLAALSAISGTNREVSKALTGTVGAGSDLGALTQAGALRVEGMDPVLFSVTVENKHFDLFNRLLPNKRDAKSMLDQQVIKKGTGGFPGSAFSTETATGRPERQGEYERLLTELGVFVDYRNVGLITGIQGMVQGGAGMVDFSAVAEENVNAALTLLETVEWGLFYGDRAVSGMEIKGLQASIHANASDHIIDMAGTYFTDHTQIAELAGRLAKRPHFGVPDLFYVSTAAKGDLDNSLTTGYRVNLDSAVPNTQVGVPVKGIRYSAAGIGEGYMDLVPHAYVEEDKTPIIVTAPLSVGPQPAPVSVTAAATSGSGSKWLAAHIGSYYYCVEACKPGEVSAPVVLGSAVAVTTGDKVTLTITLSSGAGETHYNIYRGRLGGTNAPADMRRIGRIAKAGATTTFVDLNENVPGTSEGFMLTASPARKALTWLQMLPLTQYPLAQNDLSIRWAVLLLGALRVPDARKHGMIKNILPKNAAWNPYK